MARRDRATARPSFATAVAADKKPPDFGPDARATDFDSFLSEH